MSDKSIWAEQTLTQLTKETELCTQAVLFKIDGKGDWFYLDEPLPSCLLYTSPSPRDRG